MKKFKLTPKILIVIALIIPIAVFAKKPASPLESSKTISGVIVDKVTQEQLGGAYIYFDELKKGIYSGADGSFNLEGIGSGDYKVTVKYISYHEKQVSLKVKKSGKNRKTIQMEPVQP